MFFLIVGVFLVVMLYGTIKYEQGKMSLWDLLHVPMAFLLGAVAVYMLKETDDLLVQFAFAVWTAVYALDMKLRK